MGLLTAPFPQQDTSFVSQIMLAAANQRQRQAEQAQNYALQISENQRRQAEADARLEFERQRAAELVDQFKINHIFNVAKDARDAENDAVRRRKDTAEAVAAEHGNTPYGTPALPDNVSGGVVGETQSPADQIAGTAPAPGSPDFIGPVDPNTPVVPNVVKPPDTTLPLGLPPKDFKPAPKNQDFAAQIAAIKSGLTGLPSSIADKTIADTAARIVVNGAKGGTRGMQQIAPGVWQVPNSAALYKWDGTEATTPTRIGIAPQAKEALVDDTSGEVWQRLTNGKWIGPQGQMEDAPPAGLKKIPGMFDERKIELSEDRNDTARKALEEKEKQQAKTDASKSALETLRNARSQADREINELNKIRAEIQKRGKPAPDDAQRIATQQGVVQAAGKKQEDALTAFNATLTEKKLDADTARAILREAGGDPTKARALAKERGYSL